MKMDKSWLCVFFSEYKIHTHLDGAMRQHSVWWVLPPWTLKTNTQLQDHLPNGLKPVCWFQLDVQGCNYMCFFSVFFSMLCCTNSYDNSFVSAWSESWQMVNFLICQRPFCRNKGCLSQTKYGFDPQRKLQCFITCTCRSCRIESTPRLFKDPICRSIRQWQVPEGYQLDQQQLVAMWFTCHLENLKLWTTGHMKDQIPESLEGHQWFMIIITYYNHSCKPLINGIIHGFFRLSRASKTRIRGMIRPHWTWWKFGLGWWIVWPETGILGWTPFRIHELCGLKT